MEQQPYIFNAAEVEPDAGLDPVPAGDYDLRIDATAIKELDQNRGEALAVTFVILNGDYAGRKVFNNYNVWHRVSEETVRIGRGQLSALCHVTGRMQLNKEAKCAELIGATLKATISNDGTRNSIKQVMDMSGNKPGRAGHGAGAPRTAPVAVAVPTVTPAAAPATAGWPAPGAAVVAAPVVAAPAPIAPAPVVAAPPPPAAFPPEGWAVHPENPAYYWKGTECITEAELRARSAPPAAPSAPAAPGAPIAGGNWNQAPAGAAAPNAGTPAAPWG